MSDVSLLVILVAVIFGVFLFKSLEAIGKNFAEINKKLDWQIKSQLTTDDRDAILQAMRDHRGNVLDAIKATEKKNVEALQKLAAVEKTLEALWFHLRAI